jgi:hypothetical protein
MKYVLFVLLFVCVGIFAYANAADDPQPTVVNSITITKAELDAMVSQRMAQALIDDTHGMHEVVLQGKHWHTAIFQGIEYTIYTGPGEVASATIPFHSVLNEENTDEDSTGIRK